VSYSLIPTLTRIRQNTPREPSETLDAWYKRTWQATLVEVEKLKRPLPLVEARRARSEGRLRHMFSEAGELLPEESEIENEL
jgi:hypothetical protein